MFNNAAFCLDTILNLLYRVSSLQKRRIRYADPYEYKIAVLVLAGSDMSLPAHL